MVFFIHGTLFQEKIHQIFIKQMCIIRHIHYFQGMLILFTDYDLLHVVATAGSVDRNELTERNVENLRGNEVIIQYKHN